MSEAKNRHNLAILRMIFSETVHFKKVSPPPKGKCNTGT